MNNKETLHTAKRKKKTNRQRNKIEKKERERNYNRSMKNKWKEENAKRIYTWKEMDKEETAKKYEKKRNIRDEDKEERKKNQ